MRSYPVQGSKIEVQWFSKKTCKKGAFFSHHRPYFQIAKVLFSLLLVVFLRLVQNFFKSSEMTKNNLIVFIYVCDDSP